VDQKKSISRLRRIEGQVRGIEKMFIGGRETDEIIIQLQALKSAVGSLLISIVEDKFALNDSGELTLSPAEAATILKLIRS
jgi:DNA-binding FrmR family transcriptional regulator